MKAEVYQALKEFEQRFQESFPMGAVLHGEIGDMIPRNTAGNTIPQRYRLGISADLFREETV